MDSVNSKFKIGDTIVHRLYGRGIILGNFHKRRDGRYYWHIEYIDNTFGYAKEDNLNLVEV